MLPVKEEIVGVVLRTRIQTLHPHENAVLVHLEPLDKTVKGLVRQEVTPRQVCVNKGKRIDEPRRYGGPAGN